EAAAAVSHLDDEPVRLQAAAHRDLVRYAPGRTVLERVGRRFADPDQDVAHAGFRKTELLGDGADVVPDQRHRGGLAWKALDLTGNRKHPGCQGTGAIASQGRLQLEAIGQADGMEKADMVR